jgi:hypothetical protein
VAIHDFAILKQKSPKATWLREILGNFSKFKKKNRHISRKKIMKLSSRFLENWVIFSAFFFFLKINHHIYLVGSSSGSLTCNNRIPRFFKTYLFVF